MRWIKWFGPVLGPRWASAAGAAMALTFLAPLPALALTFLTPWTLISQVRRGTAPRAFLVATGTGSQARAVVDMGETPARPRQSALSRVVIQREFRVDARNERLVLPEGINKDFKDASFSINVLVGHLQGNQFRVDDRLAPLTGSVGNIPTHVSLSRDLASRLLPRAGGRPYVVRVAITYTKGRDGFWHDHRRNGRSVSPHHMGVHAA